MYLIRRTPRQGKKYVRSGMLLHLDGRDAPVSGAWVDRVNGTACAITGTVDYIASERCYHRASEDSNAGGRVTLPTELLLNNNLYTVQVVGNQIVVSNQAFISIHANQNGSSQFSIWPALNSNTGVATIQYYTYGNGYSHGYRIDLGTNKIHSLSGSRDGGSTCKSFCDGTFDTKQITQATATNANGNTLFNGGGWNLGEMKIYSARIYNRVLSDDEVLYNYELDKKIFKAL
jgi:hypothetical protein